MKKVQVKMELEQRRVPDLLMYAEGIVASMTNNANFPAPHPALNVLTASKNALATAYTAAQSGGPAQTSIMHQKREILISELKQEGLYVEGIANDPSVADDNRDTIVLSAGMETKGHGGRAPQTFAAKHGAHSGAVHLTATAVHGASHQWEYMLQPAAANTWTHIPSTTKAETVVSGLQPGSTYSFRHRLTTKDGEGDWDQEISIMVI